MKSVKLIFKKLNHSISKEEELAFNRWLLKADENQKLYNKLKELKKTGVDISEIENIDVELTWSKVLQKYRDKKKQKNKSVKLKHWYRYAAVFVLFLFVGYGTYKFMPAKKSPVEIDPNAITLQMENGNIQILNESGSLDIKDEEGNILSKKEGSKLDYKSARVSDKLVYNTLTVPYGKTFEIALSDGTIVNLNAGSSIKYPVKFLEGKKRKVFLMGEAFFDVAKDKARPFVVGTSKMNVTVLGTEFNVSAYPEDVLINTVLVEGSVSLSSASSKGKKAKELVRLVPNQKASWNKKNSKIKVQTVDTDVYTGWIHGRLVVKNMQFKNIIKKLERKYDVSIANNYLTLDKEKFTATFDVETIEEVLGSFAENKAFNFEINNKTILINEP